MGKDKKVRVNTISQSLDMTTAGQGVKGLDGFLTYAEKTSPLGNATACADYTVMLFSDFTRKVTMQNLFHDGGFSNTGVSQKSTPYSKLNEMKKEPALIQSCKKHRWTKGVHGSFLCSLAFFLLVHCEFSKTYTGSSPFSYLFATLPWLLSRKLVRL